MKTPERNTKRVLVTEDESSISAVCRRVLTGEGFEVDIAVNGKVAQDMIDEKQYDICLLDIKLPQITGKELYQWLEEKHPQLASRVIFTTGDVMDGETRIFLERTSRPLLTKPFTPAELKSIVTETLKHMGK